MIPRENLYDQLDNCLLNARFERWKFCYKRGKVRDMYLLEDKRILITTDRQSAFDHVLGTIPLKGQVLNRIAKHWFDRTSDIAPNQVIEVPDDNVTIAEELAMIPVEVVVRAYLTGSTETSVWTHYDKGIRDFCGLRLPDGMVKNQPFKAPIITPTTKSDDHDESLSPEQIVERGLVEGRHLEGNRAYRPRPLRPRIRTRRRAGADSRRYQIRAGDQFKGRDRGGRRNPHSGFRRATGSRNLTPTVTTGARSPRVSTRNSCGCGSGTRVSPTTTSRNWTTTSGCRSPGATSICSSASQAKPSQPEPAPRRSGTASKRRSPRISRTSVFRPAPLIKSLISAALVLRLETRQVPLDMGLIVLAWLRRPVIEIVLNRASENAIRLRRKLDEVYPF